MYASTVRHHIILSSTSEKSPPREIFYCPENVAVFCKKSLALSALETFVITALYKSTFTIPYHTLNMIIQPRMSSLKITRQSVSECCLIRLFPYILFDKYNYLYFSIGNGQPREPALCQLYGHTLVPCSDNDARLHGRPHRSISSRVSRLASSLHCETDMESSPR